MIPDRNAVLFLGLAGVAAALTSAQPGTWSTKGQSLWPGPTAIADMPPSGRRIAVTAPDGRISALVTDSEARLTNPRGSRSDLVVPVQSLAEFLWAPNSSALAITESDGGWVGTWDVAVYQLAKPGTKPSRPGRLALADFKQRHPNCPDEYPNVAAVNWLHGSNDLALVVEMPCHSSCPDMCQFDGYVVDSVTGVVVRHLAAAQVRSDWKGVVGPRLAEAP